MEILVNTANGFGGGKFHFHRIGGRDLIPAVAPLTSLVRVFTSLGLLVFFYVFHPAQA
jgi:hypothetical protein